MENDIVAALGQRLMDARHQSGLDKGLPILCSDPDFGDLPLTPDSLIAGEDEYSEEDIRELSKAGLKWFLKKLEDVDMSKECLIDQINRALGSA